MTKTTATVGIVRRNSLLLIMVDMEDEAYGKSTIATQYPKTKATISETSFLRTFHVTEENATTEDYN